MSRPSQIRESPTSGDPVAGPVSPAPSSRRWERERLGEQRALIVGLCTVPLMISGTLWTAAVGISGWANGRPPVTTDILPPIALAAIGYAAYRLRARGRVRAAAYTIVVALTTNAHLSLIVFSNTEFTAVVAYCVALSVAAILIRSRELLWVGAALISTALIAGFLHHHPIIEQVALPRSLATIATAFAVVLGLPFPMMMFWFINRDLESSRADAWRAAAQAKTAMEEAEESRRQLALVADQLKHKNSELGDFLYVVSHDMRAPLINLEGFSRSLQENLDGLKESLATPELPTDVRARVDELSGEIDESLDFILRSVSKADFLVNTVLELSRLESRNERSMDIDLGELVSEIVSSLRYRLNELDAHIEIDPLPTIKGDPIRLHQVFANLLDNAVKYARTDVQARIEVRCSSEANGYVFSIRDNGVGIRPEDVSKAFRMFGRLGHSRHPGDGIGLTMIRKIIERRKGRIWVESTPGIGSTFHFTWPDVPPPTHAILEEHEHAAA